MPENNKIYVVEELQKVNTFTCGQEKNIWSWEGTFESKRKAENFIKRLMKNCPNAKLRIRESE